MESTYIYVPELLCGIVGTVVLLMFMTAQVPRIHLPLSKRIFWGSVHRLSVELLSHPRVHGLDDRTETPLRQVPIHRHRLVAGHCSLHLSWSSHPTDSATDLRRLVHSSRHLPHLHFSCSSTERLLGDSTLEDTSLFPMVNFHYGPLYYFGFLPFSYLMALASIVVLWRNYGTDHVHYVRQKLLLTFVLLLPSLTNLLYNFNLSPVRGLNLSTATLTVSGVLFYIILYRNSLLDLPPVTREQIVENLDEAVLIFNPQKRLVDFNHSAAKLFNLGRNSIGTGVEEIGVKELTHRLENLQGAESKTLALMRVWSTISVSISSGIRVLNSVRRSLRRFVISLRNS